jgi:L-asparaginase
VSAVATATLASIRTWSTIFVWMALALTPLSPFATGLLAQSPTPPGGGADLPRVLVVATGGTIASRPGADQLSGAALVEAVPELAAVARLEVEEFSRVGSSSITPDHWLRLSRRIDQVLEADPDLAGIVVTHGTDTMEETSYFLHLTVRDPRPVVVVGSMRSATAVSADGPANLLAGVRVVASGEAAGRGVLVVLNDEIHSARDVRKTDNNRVDTFVSAEWGALGVVDQDGVHFRRGILTRHTTESELQLTDAPELPRVPVVADFAGNDGSALLRWADEGIDGAVVQAFGGGRASPDMRRAVATVAGRGIPVILASRVPQGRVMGSEEAVADGILAAGDLPPHKARVLLMLALLRTRDPAEIQRLLDTH